ncbi:hypothetical protein ACHAWX_003101, partial [Stephanocyclus meneghinianus]
AQRLIYGRLINTTARKVTVGTLIHTPAIQATRHFVTPSYPSGHLRRSENVAHLHHTSNNAPTEENSFVSTAGKFFFTSLCAITFGLGIWQTQRYFDKVELVKKREEDLKRNPLNWDEWIDTQSKGAQNGSSLEDGAGKMRTYRRVILQGKFQHHNQILVGPRGPPPGALAEYGPNSGRGGGGGMSSSRQGYWVVTPFSVCKDSTQSLNESEEMEDDGGKNEKGWLRTYMFKGNKQAKKNTTDLRKECPQEERMTEGTLVWINRGWIPRHFINGESKILHDWEQPRGIVKLMTMESETETPGRFSPPSQLETKQVVEYSDNLHDFDGGTVPKLLWMDRHAISEMTNCPKDHRPPLFVQIKDENYETTHAPYPARSSREHVGEFKVTPEVHAGYAVTWYGLSGAGMVMTRKLLCRGR